MKGQRSSIKTTKGLRKDNSGPGNTEFLRKALNIRVAETGLEMLETVVNPLSGLTINHPFPQIIGGQRKNLLLLTSGLYIINSDWSKTLLLTFTSTMQAHVADFGSYVVLTNGTEVYHCDVDTGIFSVASGTNFPRVSTLTRLRGRIFGGGVLDGWNDCTNRYAVWSQIGDNSFTPDWKNQSGFQDMGIGEIFTCRSLADKMVVYYGDQGIATLTPDSAGMRYQKVSNVRLAARGSVSGGDFHLFVASDGAVWLLAEDGLKCLGYEWIIGEMTLSNIIISWDKKTQDFYISDGTECYLVSPFGMSETNQLVTSLARITGSLCGIFTSGGNSQIEIHFDQFDFLLSTMVSLEFVELSVATDGLVYISDEVSYQLGQRVIVLPWKPVSQVGYGYIGSTGTKHNPRLMVTDVTSFKLGLITLGFKLTDNRVQNQLQTISEGNWNVN